MPLPTPSTVTLSDVARNAGVSMMTVSNVLAERGGFNAETAETVRKAARKLGYRPNAAARAMAQRRFGSFALLLGQAQMSSYLPPDLLAGIEDGLAERDEHLVVARLPDAKLTDPEYVPSILRHWMADGLLVNYHVNVPDRMTALIEQTRLPAVWINVKRPTDAVRPDDDEMAAVLTRRLIGLGHRRIAYADFNTPIGETPLHYSSVDRRAGYARAMAEAGLAPCFAGRPHGSEAYSENARNCLAGCRRPTAVVTSRAADAACFLHVATVMGLSVPRDLSVATFDTYPPQVVDWKLATMLIPERELGLQAVRLLREKVAEPAEAQPTQALPGTFFSGNTVAVPLAGPSTRRDPEPGSATARELVARGGPTRCPAAGKAAGAACTLNHHNPLPTPASAAEGAARTARK